MRRIFIYLFLLPFVFCSCQKDKKSTIDLSGVWKFQIDSLDLGIKEQWFNQQLEDEILLPGSVATNGKGAPQP